MLCYQSLQYGNERLPPWGCHELQVRLRTTASYRYCLYDALFDLLTSFLVLYHVFNALIYWFTVPMHI